MFSPTSFVFVSTLGLVALSVELVFAQRQETSKPFCLEGILEYVKDVAIALDGKTVVVSGTVRGEGKLLVFDYPAGKLQRVIKMSRDSLSPIVFSPNNKQLAAACHTAIQIWDVTDGKLLMDHPGHWCLVQSMCFTRGGKTLVTGGCDNQVKVWDISKKELHANFRLPLGPGVERLVRLPCGGQRDAGPDEPRDRAPLRVELKLPIEAFYDMVLLPDNKTVAIATGYKRVYFWDITTGKNLHYSMTDHKAGVIGLALSPDGHFLATSDGGTKDSVIHLWSLSDFSKPPIVFRKVIRDYKGEIENGEFSHIRFSADGETLVAQGTLMITVWDVSTRKERFTVHTDGDHEYFGSYVLSPDGRLIATTWGDRKPPRLRFWDLSTGKELPLLRK